LIKDGVTVLVLLKAKIAAKLSMLREKQKTQYVLTLTVRATVAVEFVDILSSDGSIFTKEKKL
jgi:hypothetical protein